MKAQTVVFAFLYLGAAYSQTGAGKSTLMPAPLPHQLTLPQAEALLIERNLTVVAARQQVEVAQALRTIAGYKPNPYLQLGAEQFPLYSPVHGSYPRFFSTNSDTGAEPTYTAQVNKTFERGGKREFRMAQADAQIDIIKAQVSDAFRTQLFQLRQAFAAAMLARDNLKLAQSTDEAYAETEKLTVLRVKAGDLAEMELYRVQSGRLPFKQAILDAQTAYQQSLRDIGNLLNGQTNITPDIEIAGDFTLRPVKQDLNQLREIALAHRPDVLAARNAVRATESGVRLAEAQRSRDISVGLEYQRVGNDSAVGVVAQIPLFVYNNQKAAISQAVGQQHVAEAQLRQAESQALTDVEKAYQAYRAAESTTALYSSENLIQVEKLRRAVEYSYKRGEASLFEFLEVQRTARQAAVSFNQARSNYQLALWQLEAAIAQPVDQP